MREWIVVTVAGGIGGIVATILAERIEGEEETTNNSGPSKPPEGFWRKSIWLIGLIAPFFSWLYHLALNAVGGAIASFILWATYTSSLDFDSVKFTPAEVAAALTVGLTGVGTVRGFMRQSESKEMWKQEAKRSMEEFLSHQPSAEDEES